MMRYRNPTSFSRKTTVSLIRAWWMAARPRALAISFVTVMVGTLLAYSEIKGVRWIVVFFALLFAICIQIGTHFINDALDFEKGVDTTERIGLPKVTQLGLVSSKSMLTAGFLCLSVAFLLGIPLVLQGGWPLAFILFICVANGYLYTGGPLPLSYSGLGDLFAFLFYGLVGTLTVYYLQTGYVDMKAVLAGTQIGLLATVMTALNNLRDIVGDAKANKRTLAVRFGKDFARSELTFLLTSPLVLGLIWTYFSYPLAAFLPFVIGPLAYYVLKIIWTTEPSAHYNQLFVFCVLIQVTFSLLLCIGYLAR